MKSGISVTKGETINRDALPVRHVSLIQTQVTGSLADAPLHDAGRSILGRLAVKDPEMTGGTRGARITGPRAELGLGPARSRVHPVRWQIDVPQKRPGIGLRAVGWLR